MKKTYSATMLALAALCVSGSAWAQAVQTTHDFYRNPATPIVGDAPGGPWNFIGDALSASSIKMHFGLLDYNSISYARWVVTWNPKTGTSPTGLRLVTADDGPSNVKCLAVIRFKKGADGSDITTTEDSPGNNATFCSHVIDTVVPGPQEIKDSPIVTGINLTEELNELITKGQDKQILQQTFGNGANGPAIYSSSLEIVWD